MSPVTDPAAGDAPLHANVARVVEAARAGGLEITVRRFPAGTRTAHDAATAIGCSVGQIVKSLVFVAEGQPLVALVSGASVVDVERLAVAVGARQVRRATGSEARAATGFAIGGIPPFGHATELTVVMDAGLAAHDVVWAAAGLPDAVFETTPAQLTAAGRARALEIPAAAATPASDVSAQVLHHDVGVTGIGM